VSCRAESVASRRKTLVVGCHTEVVRARICYATRPPQIPFILVSVGAGQGVFFVLASGRVRIRYRNAVPGGDVLSC